MFFNGTGHISGYSEFDLWMGVRAFSYEVTVRKQTYTTGFWIFKKTHTEYVFDVHIHDKYNFNSATDSGDGLGSILNNIAYSAHEKGVGTDYEWDLYYTKKSSEVRHAFSWLFFAL